MMTPFSDPREQARRWIAPLVLLLFGLLTAALTWPVVAHLGSRLPGTATWAFDESTFAWNIWYFKHALLDLGASPLHSDLIWYPLGIDLILYTYNFFNAAIGQPLLLAFNLPAASNITVLLAGALSGFGAYLLALYVLRRAFGATFARQHLLEIRLAAFLAGAIYAFASNRAVYAALGHYDMVTTQWLPLYALYFIKTLCEGGRRNAVLAGLFLALAALAEMIFASFLALFSLIALLTLWREVRGRPAAIGRLAIIGLVAGLIWSPVLVPVVREFATGDYALTGWGESVKLSADLAGLVTPTDLNPLFSPAGPAGDAVTHWQGALRQVEEGKGRFGDVNTVFLGWATLVLAVAGAWLGRRVLKAWTWVALAFGVLALGPVLQINGRFRFALDGLLPEGVTFPLPFTLLHFIPVINGNRAPNRNSVLLMLALALLASYAVARLLAWVGTRARPGRVAWLGGAIVLLVALVAGEHLSVPLPTTDARVPEVYRQIAAEPGSFAVLQLPLGWRNSFGVLGSEQTNLQYFQTGHGKPMIGGNISRAPDDKMAYFARIPLFKAITDLEMYHEPSPEVDAAARAQAGALMALYDVRYFVTTPPIAGRFPYQDTWQRTEAYARAVLPLEATPAWEAEGYRAYRVIQPAVTLPFRADLGVEGAEPYVGEGWDVGTGEQPFSATANWATGREADLYLPLSEPSNVILRLAVAPLSYEGAPVQRLSVSVNGGQVLRDIVLASGWQTVEAQVPAALLRRGPNRIQLSFAWAASPREVLPDPAGRAEIGSTGVVSPVNLDVHGFTEAFITATGRDGAGADLSAGRRGYNVAVLDPKDGRVLDRHGFDTAANSFEADALAAYLESLRPGSIVAIATKGEATANLTQRAVYALRGVGSSADTPAALAGKAHALIGVRGAAPGTAAEAIALGDAFVRVSGDFRTLAAAVDWAEFAPAGGD